MMHLYYCLCITVPIFPYLPPDKQANYLKSHGTLMITYRILGGVYHFIDGDFNHCPFVTQFQIVVDGIKLKIGIRPKCFLF